MKIIEPKVELWEQGEDPIAHVAKCARVCYGNAVSKGEEADKRLYESLKKSGHLSMFRHESVYAIIPAKADDVIHNYLYPWLTSPYVNSLADMDNIYISTNKNWIIDHKALPLVDVILKYQVTPEYFANTEIGHSMMRYTFHITTQISTSRELNRVSPNNIAEKSTRYCKFKDNVVFCKPYWCNVEASTYKPFEDYWGKHGVESRSIEEYYLCSLFEAEIRYKRLLNEGVKPEDARGVLPLDTATEVVYTYSIPEWKHIIELRSDKRAHPNAQIIANAIKSELEQLGYEF